MRFRFLRLCGFVAGLVVCASGSVALAMPFRLTDAHTQRRVSSGKYPIHSACMMPPQGQLARIGVKGAEGMTKESEAWAGVLEGLVKSRLKADGVEINSAMDSLSGGASEDDVRGVIYQVQEKLHSVWPLLNKKPGGVGKSAYTLGDQVGMLPCSEKSDVLIFVQGVGQVLTEGRATMTFLVGGPAQDAAVYVTMADAKTGEIVGFIRLYPGDGFPEDNEKAFGSRIEGELWDMNIGTARKRSRPQEHEY